MVKYKYANICLVDAIKKNLAAIMTIVVLAATTSIVDGLMSTTTGPTGAATAVPTTPAAFRTEPGTGKFVFLLLYDII